MNDKHISVVFVVDDEVTISRSLAMILQHHGYLARFFTDPMEALKHIEADPPDLLISDVVMPELSGVDLAIRAQAQSSKCKILLFSATEATADIFREAERRGHSFPLLYKPVHPAVLLREIEKLEENSL